MTPICGKTYPVRRELRALGGLWDGKTQAWMVPDDRAAEARGLVDVGRARHNAARLPKVTRCTHEDYPCCGCAG